MQKNKVVEDGVFDLIDALSSPVLTHAQMWADCIPDRLIKIVPMARLKSLLVQEKFASLAETCAFMMTRTFEAPMSSEWADIYIHVSCHVCEDWWKEDHWIELSGHKELSDYENKYLLMPLRLWIYNRRRKILKQRLKDSPVFSLPVLEDFDSPVAPDIFEAKQLTLNL